MPALSKITVRERDELREEWIERLRSGKYTQGKSFLLRKDRKDHGELRYCCLGVLCEMLHEKGYLKKSVDSESLSQDIWSFGGGQELSDCALPNSVENAVGMVGNDGRCVSADWNDALTNLNDFGDLNFKDIADRLESGAYWRENFSEDDVEDALDG